LPPWHFVPLMPVLSKRGIIMKKIVLAVIVGMAVSLSACGKEPG